MLVHAFTIPLYNHENLTMFSSTGLNPAGLSPKLLVLVCILSMSILHSVLLSSMCKTNPTRQSHWVYAWVKPCQWDDASGIFSTFLRNWKTCKPSFMHDKKRENSWLHQGHWIMWMTYSLKLYTDFAWRGQTKWICCTMEDRWFTLE